MKRKRVCIDLDGVLAQYDHWRGVEHIGEPIPGAVEFTRAVAEFADVVIFTTRTNAAVNERSATELAAIVTAWLDRHGFAYHEVYQGTGKPLCAAFVDDRAVNCRPATDGIFAAEEFRRALIEVQHLVADKPLGATGEYPDGMCHDDDEGQLRLAICRNGNLIHLDFGKPVAWLALRDEDAAGLISLLQKHLRRKQ